MPSVAIDFAGVWQTKAGSDVTLLVYPYYDDIGGQAKPEPVAKLPLHGVILASIAPHFQSQLHGACQGMGRTQADACKEEEEPEAAAGGASGCEKRPGAKRKPAAKLPKTVAAPEAGVGSGFWGLLAQYSLAWLPSKEKQEPEPSAVKQSKIEPSGAGGKVLELVCFPGEPHAVPEAIMRHAYTTILPDEPALLAWMIRRADYLGMRVTVEACAAKLKELLDGGTLTLQNVIDISTTPGLFEVDHTYRAAVEQAVASLSAKVLAAQLGSTRQVLLDQQLLQQFVQLPFERIMQWATLDNLQVDSENTIAVLFTAWYDHQLDSATPATEQQCKELSALLCLDKLTPSFHVQLLPAQPHLKWYSAPDGLLEKHALARLLAGSNGGSVCLAPPLKTALARGGVEGRKQGIAKAEQQWSLSRQQLETLWAEHRLHLDGDIYLAGFCFKANLSLTSAPAAEQPGQTAKQYTVGLFLRVAWPSVLVKHGVAAQVPYPLAAVGAEFKIGTGAISGTLLIGSDWTGLGWSDVGKCTFSRVDELLTFMMASQPCVSVTLEAR